jgi:hypothetical protein
MNGCRDKAGRDGLPDMAVLQTDAPSSARRFRLRRFRRAGLARTPEAGHAHSRPGNEYALLNKYGKDSMHGVWAIPKDLPSTIDSTMPLIRAGNKMGIKSDYEKGMSALDTQPRTRRWRKP